MTDSQVAWAAGLFEGEGCIETPKGKYVRISVVMNDLDVVEKICSIMGVGKVTQRGWSMSDNIQWQWRVCGSLEAIGVLKAFLPYLCSRRSARVAEAIKLYEERPNPMRKTREGDTCGRGHVIEGANMVRRKDGRVRCRRCLAHYSRSYQERQRVRR